MEKEEEPESIFLDIINALPPLQHHAERFSREHPEHSQDIHRFLQELHRIRSELQSAVYARQKAERGV
jgi:hypothetical protein